PAGVARDDAIDYLQTFGMVAVAPHFCHRYALDEEGTRDLASQSEGGHVGVARQAGDGGRVNVAATLTGEEDGGPGTDHCGHEVAAIGLDRAPGASGEALGVLVEQEESDAELGALLQEGGQVSVRRSIADLGFIDEGEEGTALVWWQLS